MADKFLIRKTRIRVIGIGGGGNSIISELAKKVKKVSFIAANTDKQALKKVPRNVYQFHFGQEITHGLGTGMDMRLGEQAAQKEKQRIRRILKNQDFCIFIASLGGGVGSGATPVFAEVAKEFKNISLGIFTLPFKFEGERRAKIARRALERLRHKLNAILIIQNQRIFRIVDKTTSLDGAFKSLNKILAEDLADLIDLIYKPGVINIDFADLKSVLDGEGEKIYFSSAEAKGKDRAQEVVREIFNSPITDFNIKTGKKVLLSISAPSDFKMKEVEQICFPIYNLNKKAKIVFGISRISPEKKSTLKLTLLVVGEEKKKKGLKEKEVEGIKEVEEVPEKEEVKEEKVEEKEKKEEIKKPVVKKKPKKKKKKPKRRRLSALEVKKAVQEEEEKRLAEEEKWDVPAFLRRSPWKDKIKEFQKQRRRGK